jgi:2-hydroxychromene-2-carboxylate isomerase
LKTSLEFFFDCSSPWTYLAFVRLLERAPHLPINLIWKPILVGGVFNKVNGDVYSQRANPNPIKAAYYKKDLGDWARLAGVKLISPSVFPVRSVTAMRGCFFALSQDKLVPYAKALFEAYWEQDQDIGQHEVIADCASKAGLDGAACLEAAASPEAKAGLLANTEELIVRGGFGSPTFFVNHDDMFFGNDRLELVEAAIRRFVSEG